MDPNLFHIDWERTFEALGLIIILSFIIERALAMLFELPMTALRLEGGAKAAIATALSIAVCCIWHFDALSIIILTEKTSFLGYALTGAVIAGGSKASIKLFHDVLNVKSTAVEEAEDLKRARVRRQVQGHPEPAAGRERP